MPAPVLVEVDHFVPFDAFASLLADVQRGAFVIADLQPDDYVRIAELLHNYRDLRLGFVDAAVLAVVDRLGERRVATLDRRHFGVVQPKHTDALQLLPANP